MSSPIPFLRFEEPNRKTLVPLSWLMRSRADKETSAVKLVFSGLTVTIVTPDPFDIIDKLEQGVIKRIAVTGTPTAQTVIVSSIEFRDDEDEEE